MRIAKCPYFFLCELCSSSFRARSHNTHAHATSSKFRPFFLLNRSNSPTHPRTDVNFGCLRGTVIKQTRRRNSEGCIIRTPQRNIAPAPTIKQERRPSSANKPRSQAARLSVSHQWAASFEHLERSSATNARDKNGHRQLRAILYESRQRSCIRA